MNYKIPKLKLDKKNEAESVDKFLKVMGKKEVEPQDKFIVRERDLSDKGLEIIVLNP
jgi:hypothetical protein